MRTHVLLSLALVACATTAAQEASPAMPALSIERVRASLAPEIPVGDRTITIVRVDPARHRLRMLTAASDGGARTLPAWVDDFHLTGAINAAMYEVDGRSVGLLVQDGVDRGTRDDARFGGFLAFDPIGAHPPAAALGRDCPGFDLATVRARYRSLVQSYRLLDCEGRAIPWVDPKRYSAAAIGTDRAGRVVLVHVRTPYRMTALASMLAEPALGLRSMIFVEGGPEASLIVRDGPRTVAEVGSYETDFHENDDNRSFWTLPNVIGFSPR